MASNYKNTNLYTLNKPYLLESYFNETYIDFQNNYSNIYVKATLSATNISFNATNGGTLRIYWHDNRGNYDRLVAEALISSCGMNYGSRSVEGSLTVYHNSDGNLSGYAYATFTKNKTISYIPPTGGISTDWTNLTYIPRQANVTKFDNFNDEEDPTIYFNNPGGFKINARLEFSGTSINRKNISNTGSYKFELTEEERNLIRSKTPNSNTMSIRATIATCIGQDEENYWSYFDRSVNIVNSNPVFPTDPIKYYDDDQNIVAITENNQLIVQNNSKLVVECKKAESLKFSTIKKYDVVFNGQVQSFDNPELFEKIVIDKVNLTEDTKIIINAIDSRGNSTTIEKNISILEWDLPKVNLSFSRVNNFENITNLKVDVDIMDVNNKNAIVSIICKYKKSSDINFVSQVALDNNTVKAINLDNLYTWDLKFEISDKFGKKIINGVVPTGKPIMFFDIKKLSVGINGFPSHENSIDTELINGMPVLSYEVIEQFEEE